MITCTHNSPQDLGRKGVTYTCSLKPLLSYAYCKILLNDGFKTNFEILKMDIMRPSYGCLMFTKCTRMTNINKLYCKIYLCTDIPLLQIIQYHMCPKCCTRVYMQIILSYSRAWPDPPALKARRVWSKGLHFLLSRSKSCGLIRF